MCDLCDESSGCLREVVTRREKGGRLRWNRADEGEEEKVGMDSGGLDLLFKMLVEPGQRDGRCQFLDVYYSKRSNLSEITSHQDGKK